MGSGQLIKLCCTFFIIFVISEKFAFAKPGHLNEERREFHYQRSEVLGSNPALTSG